MAYTMSDKALAARKKGAKARGKQLSADRQHQQNAGRIRGNSTTPEERTSLGRAGYKATLAKYGRDHAIEIVKNHQLANPSSLELLAVSLFDRMNLAYESQVQPFNDRGILIDYLINGVYIDVNGPPHDFNPRTIARDEYVVERMGFMGRRYVTLRHDEVDDWERIVRAALGMF